MKINELNLFFEKGTNAVKENKGEGLFIPSGAVFPDEVKIDKCYRFRKDANFPEKMLLKSNDILFNSGGVGTLGRVGFYSENVWPGAATCDPFVFIIRNNDDRLFSKFLFYYFQCNRCKGFIQKYTVGSTGITSIRKKDILSFDINLPSLELQKRIVVELDIVNALRQKRKQSLQLLDNFLRATFLDMFGDPLSNSKKLLQKKIGDLGEIITGNTPSRLKSEYYGDHIEWIKSDNINTPQFNLTKAKEYLSMKGLQVGRLAPRGSVLVTCIAGSPECIGNIAMADRNVAFNQQINAFVPGKEISQKVFFAQIHFFKRLIQQVSTNSMKGMVSKGKFSEIEVLVPPKDLQKQFDEIFDKISMLRSQNQLSEAELDNEFNALTQEYFG